jgi:hypothetical protein
MLSNLGGAAIGKINNEGNQGGELTTVATKGGGRLTEKMRGTQVGQEKLSMRDNHGELGK